jgi:hypothetical protein
MLRVSPGRYVAVILLKDLAVNTVHGSWAAEWCPA